MARDRDGDSASSAGGQSKRPPLNHHESDSHSDTTIPQQRPKPHHHHPKHHVGRLHARVPSSKALHKTHGASTTKLNRRSTSPSDFESSHAHRGQQPHALPTAHRRAISEVKLPRNSSSGALPKSASHSSLKRNRSHVEISKRTRSSDKLKRTSSGTGISGSIKSQKTQVHFDLGNDGELDDDVPEDEWVDASGSNSPYLSRKGSLNSSAQSSIRPAPSANNSRPETPNHPAQPVQPEVSTPERERVQRKEYLTSRLLQRTPSQGAPPKMTADTARVVPPQLSPAWTDQDASTLLGGNRDELTSRFVEAPGSGLTSEGSFYHPPRGGSRQSDEGPRRPRSIANLPREADGTDGTVAIEEGDNSALVPRPARRPAGPAAETSRTQQKLNLQRASSVIEPGQAVSGVGGVVGASPLIGVGGPGFDGGNSRDPRVGKLLERTGMEYLVVRRYQNPEARSLNRLNHLPGMEKNRRIPRTNTASTNGKRSLDLPPRHVRNISMPDPRRPQTPKRNTSIRTNGAGSSFDGDDESRLNERLSGSSLVGGEEEDGTAALLRNLWEKSTELSASTD